MLTVIQNSYHSRLEEKKSKQTTEKVITKIKGVKNETSKMHAYKTTKPH